MVTEQFNIEKYRKEISKFLKHVEYPNFEYAVNISLKYKYIYVETPKAGCSTIKDTLQRMELDYPELIRENFEDIHVREYSPLIRPAQTCGFERLLSDNDFFVFCFVRDPYTRLLSAYLDKIVKHKKLRKDILISLGYDSSDPNRNVSFREFVDVVCEQSVLQMNPHWRVQYYQTFQDNINYDFIGKIENFNEDCTNVFSRIRKDYANFYRSELRHATKSTNLFRQFYDNDLKEKVYNKYEIDFDHFGYKKTP